jgi:hypothetical protein
MTNEVEFDKLWDSDFVTSEGDSEQGFFWKDGHFAFCIRAGKKQNIVDKEKIWETMQIIADYRAIEQAKLQEV